MKKYRVYGNVNVLVETFVEIPDDEKLDEDEILARAYDEFQGISSFCGNGGTDKLIGVNGENDALQADEEIEFTYCECLDSDCD